METMGQTAPAKKPWPTCDFCKTPSAYMRRTRSGDVWHSCVDHSTDLQTTVDEVNQQEMAHGG